MASLAADDKDAAVGQGRGGVVLTWLAEGAGRTRTCRSSDIQTSAAPTIRLGLWLPPTTRTRSSGRSEAVKLPRFSASEPAGPKVAVAESQISAEADRAPVPAAHHEDAAV